MKVPPACTYRSRIANEVASSVAVPKCIVPRLSTLTSRRVLGAVPIVRYFMRGSSPAARPARALSTSLGARARARSTTPGPRPVPAGLAPAERRPDPAPAPATVGRYVSLEQAVAESADAYYQALLDSTRGWHEGTAAPWPWLGYFTRVIAGAYAVFADRAAAAQSPGTKQQRVREHILRRAPVTFRLADIRVAVPGVSDQTIRLVLERLRNEGRVRANGTGRSATWTRTNTAPSE